MERVNMNRSAGKRSGSSGYLRTGLVSALMSVAVLSGLGAADSSTQPVAPGAAPVVTPAATPVVTPGATPAVTPGATPGVAPGTPAPAGAMPMGGVASSNDNQNNRDRTNNNYGNNNNNYGNNRRNRDRTGRDRNGNGNQYSILASDPYAVLRTRSIFVKGNQALQPEGPRNPSTASEGRFSKTPEELLVFNGVIMVGDEYNALIEDTQQNTSSMVRAGESISAALGKITAINFDSLTYVSNSGSKNVSIGQNLMGMVPSVSSYPTPSAGSAPTGGPPGPGAPAGGPGGVTGGAAPPPGSSSPEDILARLKAKRLQELGIK